jgi:hypothetical protein
MGVFVVGSSDREIHVVAGVEEFVICPNCGYADGFHSVFEGLGAGRRAKWYLICPRCSSKYDLGLEYAVGK